MKPICKIRISVLTFLALTASTFAQEPSPREQFQTALAVHQKTPTRETALKVIELYKQLDPPPAVPEEAREPFVMGVTVLKKAGDPAGAAKAADFFTQSLNFAPWFAEAYYNRALARETAGQFTGAMDDLKFYMEFKLSDNERREVQDKIYSLKADAQLSAAKKAEERKAAAVKAAADTPQAREAALLQMVEGAKFVNDHNFSRTSIGAHYTDIYEVKNGRLYLSLQIFSMGLATDICGYSRPGVYSIGSASYRDSAFTITDAAGDTYVHHIRPDGKALLSKTQKYPERVDLRK